MHLEGPADIIRMTLALLSALSFSEPQVFSDTLRDWFWRGD
jgi:hypothetical protein